MKSTEREHSPDHVPVPDDVEEATELGVLRRIARGVERIGAALVGRPVVRRGETVLIDLLGEAPRSPLTNAERAPTHAPAPRPVPPRGPFPGAEDPTEPAKTKGE